MGVSIWQLLIILLIIIVLFGTKKLRNIGGDLGAAIKNFRQSMKDNESSETTNTPASIAQSGENRTDEVKVLEGEVTTKQTNRI